MQPTDQREPQQAAPQQAPPAPVQRTPPVVNSAPEATVQPTTNIEEIFIYSHSSLFYWWPVWVVGFIMAGITYWGGHAIEIGNDRLRFYPSSDLGVIFFFTVFLVILITNISVRGLASALVIVTLAFVTLLLAYFRLWDPVLNWLGNLRIELNDGAYFWFSTLMFIVWAFTVFIFDRMSYWRITPGQITHEFVLGASAKSYDTENMVFEKYRNDFFRHWVLGMGSGDLHILPFGARQEEIEVPNVLFIGSKLLTIQYLISVEPDQLSPVPKQ